MPRLIFLFVNQDTALLPRTLWWIPPPIFSISRTTFLLFPISLFFMYSSDKDVIASIALSMALSNLLHASSISLRLGNSCFAIKNSNLFRESVKLDLVRAFSLFSDVSISAFSFEIPVKLTLIVCVDVFRRHFYLYACCFPRKNVYNPAVLQVFDASIVPMIEITPK